MSVHPLSVPRLGSLRLVEALEKVNKLQRHRLAFDSLIKRPQLGSDYGIAFVFPDASSQYAWRAPVGPIVHFSIPHTEGPNPPAVFHSYVAVCKLFPKFGRRAHNIDVSCVTPPPITGTLRTIV